MDHDDLRRWWAERSGEYSPEYYAHYGPNDTSESVRAAIDRFVDPGDAVLEVGCSSGRHLSHLQAHGFGNLSGVELNDAALAVMADAYPDLAAEGTFYPEAIEDVIEEFADRAFDAVYSVETLQHLHPDAEWVFAELARITGAVLVTVENEGEGPDPGVSYVNDEFPLYHRDYNQVFTELGFVEVEVAHGQRDTMRTFRPPPDRPGS